MKNILDISYGACAEQKLDIHLPEGNVRAALIYIHGGGITGGDKGGKECLAAAETLAAEGIALISVEYRKYPGAKYPEFIEDCAAAAAFVSAHAAEYGLDCPVYLGGSSAGAYITGMLAFDGRYLAAQGMDAGMFAGFVLDAAQPTTHFNVLKERGEDPRRCIVDEASILYHVTGSQPERPLLIIFSDNDMPARKEQNLLLRATLEHMDYDGSLIDMREMQGYKHCQYNFDADEVGRNVLAKLILDFIDR